NLSQICIDEIQVLPGSRRKSYPTPSEIRYESVESARRSMGVSAAVRGQIEHDPSHHSPLELPPPPPRYARASVTAAEPTRSDARPIRVLVVDDHPVVRDGLRAML